MMQFLMKLHDTNGNVTSFCLYYRYIDLLFYSIGIGVSVNTASFLFLAICASVCGISYLIPSIYKQDKMDKEVCTVMGVLHILLSFMIFVIIYIS